MWYYTLNNQQVGPVDEKEIRNLIAAGTITHGTQVWSQGMANWLPISQSPLASFLGAVPPPPVGYAAPAVYENPKVASLNKLFTWFWISLIGILLFGLGAVAAAVLFFIIIYKAWQLVQHEGVRGHPDKMVAFGFIPGWNFYWYFPEFVGLARELNAFADKENLAVERINLDLAKWMIICIYGSAITFGLSLIAFIVLWIMYTAKVKNILAAAYNAGK